MIPIVLPDVITLAGIWTLVDLPDKVRKSIKIQAYSLGVLEYSFDAGVTFMKTVGAGDELEGNFSLKQMWFKTQVNDVVKIQTTDKLY